MGKSQSLILYQRVLGNRFQELPIVFQKMHGASKSTFAQGNVLVEYGTHFLARMSRPFMPIPPKGTYPLRLEIHRTAKGEEWLRKFPEHEMTSFQYVKNNCLYEQFGWIRFSFNLHLDKERLIFECKRQYLGFVPIPRIFMVKPLATAISIDQHTWKLSVKITFLHILLAQYIGEMHITNL